MPHYMIQVAYTAEAWANLVKNPQDRIKAVTPAVDKLGGKVEVGYLAFGEYDIVVIVEMPDNVSAAALAIAFSAGGALKAAKTTPLLTTQEGIDAMKKATATGYRPAG